MSWVQTTYEASFWRRALPLFTVGMVGAVALLAAQLGSGALPVRGLALAALTAVGLIQLAVLVGVHVAVGTATAARAGLRSYLTEWYIAKTPFWQNLRPEIPLAASLGTIATLLMLGLDRLTQPFFPAPHPDAAAITALLSHTTPLSVLAALLYGGLTEEVLLRWGWLGGLLWLGGRLTGQAAAPSARRGWVTIAVVAVLFGVGHLPTIALIYPLTAFVVLRTVLLNAIFGIAAGWLCWRRSLEAAMVAHVAVHIVLTAVNLALAGSTGL